MAVKTTSGWKDNDWSIKTATNKWSVCEGGWVKTANSTWQRFYTADGGTVITNTWQTFTIPAGGQITGSCFLAPNSLVLTRRMSAIVNYSTNGGQSWMSAAAPSAQTWGNLVNANQRLVCLAGRNGKGMWSSNGSSWNQTTTIQGDGYWGRLATDTLSVLGVQTDEAVSHFDKIVFSSNAISFTVNMLPTNNINWTLCANAGYSDYMIAAPGKNTTLRTTDITSRGGNGTWKSYTLPETENWSGLCGTKPGEYIILGSPANQLGNKYALFKNGVWTSRRFPVPGHWSKAFYFNGVFLVVSKSGNIALMSRDGETWSSTQLPSVADWSTACADSTTLYLFPSTGTTAVKMNNLW